MKLSLLNTLLESVCVCVGVSRWHFRSFRMWRLRFADNLCKCFPDTELTFVNEWMKLPALRVVYLLSQISLNSRGREGKSMPVTGINKSWVRKNKHKAHLKCLLFIIIVFIHLFLFASFANFDFCIVFLLFKCSTITILLT